MRRISIDTNAYAALRQGDAEVVAILQHADIVGISTIVLGELIAGFTIGSKTRKYLEELNEFLNTPRINIFPVDETTTNYYAQVYANLRNKGKPIPTNDLWIAATALQHGCKLCSFDKHFNHVDNLIVTTALSEFLF